ncbi:leucine-rich repeat protein [bacterium]|nr:leucine-rich repeat protein [bacterium]
MSEKAEIIMRMEPEKKRRMEEFFEGLGLSLPYGVSIFFEHCIFRQGYRLRRSCPSAKNVFTENEGDFVFYGCSSLKSLTIPVGVTSVGDDAFYACDLLKSITFRGRRYTDKDAFNQAVRESGVSGGTVWS